MFLTNFTRINDVLLLLCFTAILMDSHRLVSERARASWVLMEAEPLARISEIRVGQLPATDSHGHEANTWAQLYQKYSIYISPAEAIGQLVAIYGEYMKQIITNYIRFINDNPDPAHSDYTPSVLGLIKVGPPAIGPVLDLMLSPDHDTRLHAQRVLEGITLKQHGFVTGKGWIKENGEKEWHDFWNKMGSLSADDPVAKRADSIKLWRKWWDRKA